MASRSISQAAHSALDRLRAAYCSGASFFSRAAAVSARERLCFTMALVKRLLLVMPQYSSGPLQNSRLTFPASGAGE